MVENGPQWEAVGFYSVIGVPTLLGIGIGIGIDWSPLDPIRALFWSAVLNGWVAVTILAALMMDVARKSAMEEFIASRWSLFFSWAVASGHDGSGNDLNQIRHVRHRTIV